MTDSKALLKIFWEKNIVAALSGHQEVVALFLQQPGIDTNAADLQGWTALHWAAYIGQEDAGLGVLRRLLACTSIDPNVKNVAGKTPIMWLLQRDGNQVERLQAFVECDKVDLDDQDGRSLEDLAR